MADSLFYQNPTVHDFQLDNIVVTPGTPDLVREALVVGDGAGGANYASVTSDNALKVDGSAVTQPVSISGSVPVTGTFFQATQPVSLASLPALTAGAALIGQVEVSDGTNVLFTSGHAGYVQFPSAQAVTVSSGAITATGNITQWNSVNLGSPSNYGTSPGAVSVIGVNSFVTNIVQVSPTTSAISKTNPFFTQITDGTNTMGAMTVFGSTPGAVDALIVNASLFQGTTAVGSGAPLQVSLANTGSNGTAVNVNATIAAAQTIAVTNVGTFAVQEATLDAALISQEATTSSVKGLTAFGAVTTSAPTYSTSKSDALSLDTAGNLRIVLNAETSKVIGTVNIAAAQTIAVTNTGTFAVQAVGTLTNNNAAPAATNIGVLSVLANAAVPTWTEGDQVLLSSDLSGRLRTLTTAASQNSAGDGSTNTTSQFLVASGSAFAPSVYPFLYNGSTWDRVRSTGIGNNVSATGILAASSYGQYNATIETLTDTRYSVNQVDTTGSQYVNIEGRKATYSAFASFTAVAGDIAVLPGSASKTIRITRVEVSFVTTGTAAVEAVQLIKRSAADTGGTSGAMTAVPHDSGFASASAAPLSYTVAPTPGAAVGTVRGVQFNDASSALPGANSWIWDFGARPSAAIVLRGVAQQLAINLPTAISTQTATVSFEWTEE